jgi:hypothetical protein
MAPFLSIDFNPLLENNQLSQRCLFDPSFVPSFQTHVFPPLDVCVLLHVLASFRP